MVTSQPFQGLFASAANLAASNVSIRAEALAAASFRFHRGPSLCRRSLSLLTGPARRTAPREDKSVNCFALDRPDQT